jgi:hypothetical protein
MNILCTSSDAKVQFEGLSRLRTRYQILFLDRHYDLQVSPHEVLIWQTENKLHLDSDGLLVYLLFRAPNEGITDPSESLAVLEQAELLEEASTLVSARMPISGAKWRRAYLKSSLLSLSHLFPKLVPSSFLLSGSRAEGLATADLDRIVKCGFGVKRAIQKNLSPQATFIAAGQSFHPGPSYRYLIQDYIAADKEFRTYLTRINGEWRVNTFEMPVGSRDAPDWRDTTLANDLRCIPVRRDDLDNISISLAEKLELDYVCFDFLATGDAFYLIDINPHGSWAWLPEEARGLVDSQMEAWLTSLLV